MRLDLRCVLPGGVRGKLGWGGTREHPPGAIGARPAAAAPARPARGSAGSAPVPLTWCAQLRPPRSRGGHAAAEVPCAGRRSGGVTGRLRAPLPPLPRPPPRPRSRRPRRRYGHQRLQVAGAVALCLHGGGRRRRRGPRRAAGPGPGSGRARRHPVRLHSSRVRGRAGGRGREGGGGYRGRQGGGNCAAGAVRAYSSVSVSGETGAGLPRGVGGRAGAALVAAVALAKLEVPSPSSRPCSGRWTAAAVGKVLTSPPPPSSR